VNYSAFIETNRVHAAIKARLVRLLVRLEICGALKDHSGYAIAGAEFDISYFAAMENLRRMREAGKAAA
jgi:hypothetical protein